MAENFQLAKTSSTNMGAPFIARHLARWVGTRNSHRLQFNPRPMPWVTLLALVLAFFIAAPPSMAAQTAQNATVTFYSDSKFPIANLPGSKEGIFMGSLFDGQELLFKFYGRIFQYIDHRFVTILVPPGAHEFTASLGKNLKKGAHVQMNLEAGKEYFLRVSLQPSAYVVVGNDKPILEEMLCADAHSDLAGAKRLTPKRTGPALQIAPPRSTFPDCPAQPSTPAHP